jgi:hypothetical protein
MTPGPWRETLQLGGSRKINGVGNVAALKPAWTIKTLGMGSEAWLRALVHIAISGPENEIDCGGGQSLELGIAFMLTDSCQPTV